jgi:hypothetical protein
LGDAALPDDSPASSLAFDVSDVFQLVRVRLPQSAMGTLKLHDVRGNKWYHVDMYLDETIGDVKALLHSKYNVNINDGGRLLIALPLTPELPDSEVIFNLDLSKVYIVVFSRAMGMAPRAVSEQTNPEDPPDFPRKVATIVAKGFPEADARSALRQCKYNTGEAVRRVLRKSAGPP